MGSYDVMVNVVDEYGCVSNKVFPDYIVNAPLEINVNVNGYNFSPDDELIFCNGTNQYISCTNYDVNYQWSYNGSTSSNSNIHFDAVPGMMPVYLTISDDAGNCEDTISIPFDVEVPNLMIDTSEFLMCDTIFDTTFTAHAVSDLSYYHWSIVDSVGSDGYLPTFPVYLQQNEYQIQLAAVTENGCWDTAYSDIIVSLPLTPDVCHLRYGCVPYYAEFDYLLDIEENQVVNFIWEFHDGTVEEGMIPSNSYLYTDSGNYYVDLTIVDQYGCENYDHWYPEVGYPETALFDPLEFGVDTICSGDTTFCFTNLSYDTAKIDRYYWHVFSDEILYEFVYNEPVDFCTSLGGVGWTRVSLSTLSMGCFSDTATIDSVYIVGPKLDEISSYHTCEDGFTYHYYMSLLGDDGLPYDTDLNVYYIDDVGDTVYVEDVDINGTNFEVTYPNVGIYILEFYLWNEIYNCDTIYKKRQTYISLPLPEFKNPDDDYTVCVGNPIEFDANYSQFVSRYKWDFGDGVTTEWDTAKIASHIYFEPGNYVVTLYGKDQYDCIEEYQMDVLVVGPTVEFLSDPIVSCLSDNGNYSMDISITSQMDIDYYQVSINGMVLENLPDPSGASVELHIDDLSFEDAGLYDVEVYAVSNQICEAFYVEEHFFDLIELNTLFFFDNTPLCFDPVEGNEVEFYQFEYNDDYIYTYDYGDGTSGNVPYHTYTAGGKHTICLTVEDTVRGCISSYCNPDSLQIIDPFISIDLSDIEQKCYPDEMIIHALSSNPNDLDILWNINPVSNPEINIPGTGLHPTFTLPLGDYVYSITASALVVPDCNSTVDSTFTINGIELPSLILPPDMCDGDTIELMLSSYDGIDSILWQSSAFENGFIMSTSDTVITNSITPNSSVAVSCAVYVENCPDKTLDMGFIDVKRVDATISGLESNDFFCEKVNVDLEAINYIDADMFKWSINDTISPNVTSNPNYNVNLENESLVDKVYQIYLESYIDGMEYCRATDTVEVIVGAVPEVNISNVNTVCRGDSVQLLAEGGVEYQWSPSTYLSSNNVANPYSSPLENIEYTVVAYSERGCKSSGNIMVYVQDTAFGEIFAESDTIIIGNEVFVDVSADQDNVVYSWLPDDESISCIDCPNPVLNPEVPTEYFLVITDSLGCYSTELSIRIEIDYSYSIDVPNAFTPEGNYVNSVVYVRGHGIRNLLEFSIYNRWGELMFRTDDINKGWDGYFRGELQSMDTYVFQVEAEMYDGNIRFLKGDILLMR